jgi:hypothetical protein
MTGSVSRSGPCKLLFDSSVGCRHGEAMPEEHPDDWPSAGRHTVYRPSGRHSVGEQCRVIGRLRGGRL